MKADTKPKQVLTSSTQDPRVGVTQVYKVSFVMK